LLAVTFVALLVAAFSSAAYTDLVTCGGDGGSPFAAPASPRGRYCDSGLPMMSIVGGPLLAVVGSFIAAWRGRWWPLLGCGVIAAVLVISPAVFAVRLSGMCANEPRSPHGDQLDRYYERQPDCLHY
jgi:hypothetical protein